MSSLSASLRGLVSRCGLGVLWGRPARERGRSGAAGPRRCRAPAPRRLVAEPLEQRTLLDAGDLDLSFHGDGLVTTRFPAESNDGGYAVAIQSDGKVLVAGYSDNGTNPDFAVVRYNTDGSLDTGFDTDGKVTTPIGASRSYARSVAVQADGKILVAGYSTIGGNSDFAVVRYNADGSLDTSFDTDGKVTTPIGTSSDCGYSMAVQADGKIVVAGYAINSTIDFALVRYNADGSLDTGFDSDGKVTTSIGAGRSDDLAYSVAVQADGKILVAGLSSVGTNSGDFALVRYNADGSLDTSFDTDGKVTTPIGAGDDVGYSVAVQADGKILLAGRSHNGSDYDFAVVRCNADGSLDTSFDTDGKVTTPIGASSDCGHSTAVQADGKILVAGYASWAGNFDFAVVRYNADGSLDTGFDADGVCTTGGFGASLDNYGYSVAVQADSKIIVAGESYNGNNQDFAAVRYNADGSLDTSFDTDGKVTTPIGAGDDVGYSVAVQADGKILLAGYAATAGKYNFALVRYNADGSLDAGFDTDGKVTTPIGASSGYGRSVAVQADGKILLAGYASIGGNYDFALVRYNNDGSLDTGFGTDGKVTTPIGTSSDCGYSMAVQADGKILMAGSSNNGSDSDFALVRFNTDGSADTGFGTEGKVTTPIGTSDDTGYSVTVQADGKILLAGESYNGSNYVLALVRYNADGSLDAGFDTDGKVTTWIGNSSSHGYGRSVAVQGDGKIVVAGYWGPPRINGDFALVRYNANGTLDTGFGAGGKVSTPIGSTDDRGYSMAVQADGRILVAGYSKDAAVGRYAFAVARYEGFTSNKAPSFTATDPAAINEDAGAQTVSGWVTSFVAGPAYESAQGVLAYLVSNVSNPGLFAVPPAVTVDGTLSYTPAADAYGSSTFEVTVQDDGGTEHGGADTSLPQTYTITVHAVNDQPSFTATDPPAINEDAGPQTVLGWVTSFTPGPPDESSQQALRYIVSDVSNAALFSAGPVVAPDGTLTYAAASHAFGISTFRVSVQDDGGTERGGIDTSAAQTFAIAVTANQAPTFTATDPPAINEDAGAQTVSGWVTSFVAGPAYESSQQVLAYLVGNVSNPALFAVPPAVTVDGTLSYTPAADAYGSSTFEVAVRDDGGTEHGGVDTSLPQTFTITVNPVVELPSGGGTNTVLASRKGDNVQVLDSRRRTLFNQPRSSFRMLTIQGVADKSDIVKVDLGLDAGSLIPDGIVFDGGGGKKADTLVLYGTAGADTFAVDAGSAVVNGLGVQLRDIAQLTLEAGKGDDTYQVSSLSTKTTISDSKGIDTLDFSQAAAGVTVYLAARSGQEIFAPTNSNTLTLKGTIENVIGTESADQIKGNSAVNRIEGRGDNDMLYGGSGNDALYGGSGDDWLYSEAGNDTLYGGPGNNVLLGGDGNDLLDVSADVPADTGRNLLIGGKGQDILQGGNGQEIVIGGTTSYDSKAAALAAIMKQWTSGGNDSFGNRCSTLATGYTDPTAGWIQLKRKDKTNVKGTVLDDRVRDSLFGGPGSDWFFDFAKDEVHDP
jgi:uncharacterized delta-60 repeat protein